MVIAGFTAATYQIRSAFMNWEEHPTVAEIETFPRKNITFPRKIINIKPSTNIIKQPTVSSFLNYYQKILQ